MIPNFSYKDINILKHLYIERYGNIYDSPLACIILHVGKNKFK